MTINVNPPNQIKVTAVSPNVYSVTSVAPPPISVIASSTGATGLSAYEIWLGQGHTGSESDFLAWLIGPKGDPGNDGLAATIQVGTVTTGPAGSTAIITNQGSPNAAIFDFTIPKGDTGSAANVQWADIQSKPDFFAPLTHGNEAHSTAFATETELGTKVDKVAGKALSTNDYTDVEKTKLSGIQAGAEVNVNADWTATSGDAQILHKPSIPTALTDLSDVTIASPGTGQIIKYNGSEWVNGDPVTTNAGAGVNLYPTSTPSDISPYYYFEKAPDIVAEVNIPVTCNNNKVLISEYISDPSIALSKLDAGVWIAYMWSYASIAGDSQITTDIYKRSSVGTETFLFGIVSANLGTTLQQFITSTVQPEYIFNVGDRLIFKIYGQTTNIIDTVIHGVGGGNQHFSYMASPLVVAHNDLSGLQGGTSGQYYHLTSVEKSIVDATSGANTGDETQSTIVSKLGTVIGGANGLATLNASAQLSASQIPDSVALKAFSIAMSVALG